MRVRLYRDSDLTSVVQIFTDSVHALTTALYTEPQRLAWAPKPPDLDSWRGRLSGLTTYVADSGDRTAWFISYGDNGHIDLLYVAPGF